MKEKPPRGFAARVVLNLEFIRGGLLSTSGVTSLLQELRFLTVRVFSRPTPRLSNPSSPQSVPLQPTSLTVPMSSTATLAPHPHPTGFFTDTCWNEEQPSGPWTNTVPPPSSPLRAVIGKHLKYCDHLQ